MLRVCTIRTAYQITGTLIVPIELACIASRYLNSKTLHLYETSVVSGDSYSGPSKPHKPH